MFVYPFPLHIIIILYLYYISILLHYLLDDKKTMTSWMKIVLAVLIPLIVISLSIATLVYLGYCTKCGRILRLKYHAGPTESPALELAATLPELPTEHGTTIQLYGTIPELPTTAHTHVFLTHDWGHEQVGYN